MLLTLSPPGKTEFGFKAPHGSSSPLPPSTSRFSLKSEARLHYSLPAAEPWAMDASRRGLPPPSSMTLPDPGRGPPSLSQQMGQMPAPPSQWQGAEESMRNWLHAKAEEDKRKQEEEKTRQETLKLEQRKIEHSMLRESMQGGIPAPLVPVIFAGMGGGNLASTSLEWAQQYMVQLQQAVAQQQFQQQHEQQQQQQQHFPRSHISPELRRGETRTIGQPQSSIYASAPQAPPPPPPSQLTTSTPVSQGPPLGPQSHHTSSFPPPTYQVPTMSPTSRSRAVPDPVVAGGPTSAPRPPTHSSLPRLNTNELHPHQPSSAPPGIHLLHQTHAPQASQHQEQTSSSPSIYFHHWVPPTSQAGSSGQTAQSSGKLREQAASRTSMSHVSDPDYANSPKKRKGAHLPGPASLSNRQASPAVTGISSSASTPARRMAQAHTRNRSSTVGHESRRSQAESCLEQDPPERQRRRERSLSTHDMGRTQQPQQHLAGPERASAPASPKRET